MGMGLRLSIGFKCSLFMLYAAVLATIFICGSLGLNNDAPPGLFRKAFDLHRDGQLMNGTNLSTSIQRRRNASKDGHGANTNVPIRLNKPSDGFAPFGDPVQSQTQDQKLPRNATKDGHGANTNVRFWVNESSDVFKPFLDLIKGQTQDQQLLLEPVREEVDDLRISRLSQVEWTNGEFEDPSDNNRTKLPVVTKASYRKIGLAFGIFLISIVTSCFLLYGLIKFCNYFKVSEGVPDGLYNKVDYTFD